MVAPLRAEVHSRARRPARGCQAAARSARRRIPGAARDESARSRRRALSAREGLCGRSRTEPRAASICWMLWKSPRITGKPNSCYWRSYVERRQTTSSRREETRALIENFQSAFEQIRTEVRKIIVGQDEVVEHLLLTLLVGGHCLITGMPGTAKTLLVRTLASALGLTFKRIQFTPDLMPTDVTGTDIIEEDMTTGRRTWTFVPGPLFTNVLLADEINRTPPKTQSALLEAMQELSVTVRGHHHKIDAAVLRARDAEPDRARRHLSAARSAARPLPVQRAARLLERRGRGGGRRRATRRGWTCPRSMRARRRSRS